MLDCQGRQTQVMRGREPWRNSPSFPIHLGVVLTLTDTYCFNVHIVSSALHCLLGGPGSAIDYLIPCESW